MATTRLLSPEDIYDVYGCESLIRIPDLEPGDLTMVTMRLTEIRDIYVAATKSRIRAEAVFCGVKLDGDQFRLEDVLDQIKKSLTKAMEAEADKMARGGSFNLMQHIMKAHVASGTVPKGVDPTKFGINPEALVRPKTPDVDPNWFMKQATGRMWDNPKWAEIAKTFLDVEKAETNQQIVSAIDRLNQLQHNSFHVLIDLQTGRMLRDYTNQSDDREARKRLQEVLDMKLNARSVMDFAAQMSGDVRKLLVQYRRK